MSLKIAFTGAEATGKTTLALELSKKLPHLEVVKPTRMVDGYLTKTEDIQKQILVTHIEVLMQRLEEGFICDRTLFDVCAYSMVKGVWDDNYVKGILEMYSRTKIFPDYVFYTPIEFDFVQDGGRPEGTREAIDGYIKSYLDTYASTEYITVRGSVEERMETILRAIQGD